MGTVQIVKNSVPAATFEKIFERMKTDLPVLKQELEERFGRKSEEINSQ